MWKYFQNIRNWIKKAQENNSRLAENKRIKALENKIIKLLKSDSNKLPASDIDAILKHTDVGEIRGICEELYHDGKINRTGNYRYFIYDVKPKKKTGSLDVAKEIKDFAKLKEEGFITEAEFKAKKAKLLDL